ncbi:hypothetical protein V5799_000735 [Amblyomma americanum]|uniref:Seven cysteines N-terminal domain-containing protein n=1 Tax=Amblyomma americanum TaxID=6943 RepID=A0AAQ4D277_AMBAM
MRRAFRNAAGLALATFLLAALPIAIAQEGFTARPTATAAKPPLQAAAAAVPSGGRTLKKRPNPSPSLAGPISAAARDALENFQVNENRIIRTEDSRRMGARYLNETELSSNRDCLLWCWETTSCNVAVFEEKFRCQNSSECIAVYNVCDGIPQCVDGSDEAEDLKCPGARRMPNPKLGGHNSFPPLPHNNRLRWGDESGRNHLRPEYRDPYEEPFTPEQAKYYDYGQAYPESYRYWINDPDTQLYPMVADDQGDNYGPQQYPPTVAPYGRHLHPGIGGHLNRPQDIPSSKGADQATGPQQSLPQESQPDSQMEPQPSLQEQPKLKPHPVMPAKPVAPAASEDGEACPVRQLLK